MPATIFKGVAAVHHDAICPILASASQTILPPANDSSNTNAPGGLAIITYGAGAGAYSLKPAVAGGPTPSASSASQGASALGGDDGKALTILSTTAQSHVVTCGASGAGNINAGKNTITFAAAGNFVKLEAYNGVWWVVGQSLTGITLGGS
jgi:hypothetical protein